MQTRDCGISGVWESYGGMTDYLGFVRVGRKKRLPISAWSCRAPCSSGASVRNVVTNIILSEMV